MFSLFFLTCTGFAQDEFLDKIIVSKDKFSPHEISQDRVLDSLSVNSISYLNSLSGVDLQTRGTFAAQQDISLWGSNFQQVLITINGKNFNDPQTAHYNLDLPFSNQDIALTEVKNTDSAVQLGPGCSFGAVNFLIKKANDNKTIFEAGVGNHDTFSGLISATMSNDSFGNRITFERMISDGFQPFTEQKQLKFSDFFSIFKDDFSFDLGFGYIAKDLGAYDFYTPGSGFASKEMVSTKFLIADSEFDFGQIKIKPGFLMRKHKDTFILERTNPNLYMNNHKSDVYSTYLDIESESGFGKLDLGLRLLEEKINSLRLNKHRRMMYSAYINDRIDINQFLACTLGYRFDYSDEYAGLSSGSILFDIMVNDHCSLFVQASRSLRLPSYTELYYSDSTTIGNSGLSCESGYKYELGYKSRLNKVDFIQSVFLKEQDNEIDWVKVNTSSLWQAENLDSSILGVNNMVAYTINPNFKLVLNYTYTNKYSQDGFNYKYGVSNTKHLISSGVNLKKNRFSHYFGLSYKKKASRDGWVLCDYKTVFEVNSNKRIFLEADNLFNVEYEQIEGIPSPGRLVRLGMRLNW